MSDRDWYEGLTAEEFEGKHVRVQMDDGEVIEGRLEYESNVVSIGKHGQSIFERIEQIAPCEVSEGVESVSLVWDERDWVQISTEDVSKADMIVVNGDLLQVTRVMHDVFLVGEFDLVPVSFVSCALRRKVKLPTEPGYYRNDSGIVVELTSGSPAEWWMLPTGSQDSQVSAEFVSSLLPLTPVHFVDGRADHE